MLLFLYCGLTAQSTAMVMSRRRVNLTTLFLGKLRPKRLTSTYGAHSTVLAEPAVEEEWPEKLFHDQSPRKNVAGRKDRTHDRARTRPPARLNMF